MTSIHQYNSGLISLTELQFELLYESCVGRVRLPSCSAKISTSAHDLAVVLAGLQCQFLRKLAEGSIPSATTGIEHLRRISFWLRALRIFFFLLVVYRFGFGLQPARPSYCFASGCKDFCACSSYRFPSGLQQILCSSSYCFGFGLASILCTARRIVLSSGLQQTCAARRIVSASGLQQFFFCAARLIVFLRAYSNNFCVRSSHRFRFGLAIIFARSSYGLASGCKHFARSSYRLRFRPRGLVARAHRFVFGPASTNFARARCIAFASGL